MQKITICALIAVMILFFGVPPAGGQQTTATLVGVVLDPTGAFVPGVLIKATNLDTTAVREATTDQAGNYSIPFLPAGTYQVTANKEGFQAQKVDSITLQVEQAARVDFTLQVGNAAETVNVSAAIAALQTENASVGSVIDAGKIVELPLNGRNFIQLAQLIPGVQAGTPTNVHVSDQLCR